MSIVSDEDNHSENHKRRSSQSPYNDRSKKSRIDNLEMESRFLIPSKNAGAIIGKGGATINMLRDKYNITLSLPDSSSPERILTLSGSNLKKHIDCLEEILQILKEGNRVEDDKKFEVKMIVHQSQAGGVIGRGGTKIKEIREKTGATLKVFSACCPNSSDRIVLIGGTPSEIIECIYEVYDILDKAPPKGPKYNYNPYDYDYYLAPDYGGYQGERAPRGGGGDGPRGSRDHRDQRSGGGGGRNRGGGGKDSYSNHGGGGGGGGHHGMFPFGNASFGAGKMMGGGNDMGGFFGGGGSADMMMGFGGSGGGMGKGPHSLFPKNGEPETTTQVTIPQDLAGSIIGKGGERIRQIREESCCKIKIDETVHEDNERIITIEGTPEGIRYAQILLQDAVKRFGGKKSKY